MALVEVVVAEVRFRALREGGRQSAPALDGTLGSSYRPHLVVADSPDEAHRRGGEPGKGYIGVASIGGPSEVALGETVVARFALLYPEQDTTSVVPGTTFTLREGQRIVADGRVVSRGVEEL